MKNKTKEKIVIGVCGDPDSGKSIVSFYLRKLLPVVSRQYIEASVDGNGTIGDSPDQNFLRVIRRNGELSSALIRHVQSVIDNTEASIVIVDIGGLPCFENVQILTCCDYCILVNKTDKGQERWKCLIESLKPGEQVEYVERYGTPIYDSEVTDDMKIGIRNGKKFRLEDRYFSKPYEEITLGGKSPKIVLEVASRRSKTNPELSNQVKEENGIVKATLLDLERGNSDRIQSRIDVDPELYMLLSENDRAVVKATLEMYYAMLLIIAKDRNKTIGTTKEVPKTVSEDKHIDIIQHIREELDRIGRARVRGNNGQFYYDYPTLLNFYKGVCSDNIQELLLSIKEFFTIENESNVDNADKEGYDILNFYRINQIISGSEWLKETDIMKLIILYDIFLDSKKNENEIALYGSRMLLSTAAFVEEAKKDGIHSIKIHSASFDTYIECQRLQKSNDIGFGTKINGIKYYIETNDTTKTALVHLDLDKDLVPSDLGKIVLPDLPTDYKIYFSGIIPDWLIGSLSMSYDNTEKAILKPDTRGKHLITYASENFEDIGMQEDNPPGIDIISFFNKIPTTQRVFKEDGDSPTQE